MNALLERPTRTNWNVDGLQERAECRQFILKRRWTGADDVQKLVRRPCAGMLPPPSWHTDTEFRGEQRPQIFAMIRDCSDRELVTLLDLHRQFLDGAAWWRASGSLRHLSQDQAIEAYGRAETVQYWMSAEVQRRFIAALEKREDAGRKSAWKRKARAA